MKKIPLISVIVPIYNTEEYLPACIDSILKQTYHNIELLLINDGSTDNSLDICREYEAIDHRIRVINKKNEGTGITKNLGIVEAKGEYLTIVDSDDVISEDMLETLYSMCIKYEVPLAQCMYTRDEKQFIKDRNAMTREYLLDERKCFECLLYGKYGVSFCILCGKLIKCELAKKVILPKVRAYEDIYTAHWFYSLAKKIAFTDKCMYFYRQREASVTYNEHVRPNFNGIKSYIIRAHFFKKHGYILLYEIQMKKCLKIIREFYLKYYRCIDEIRVKYINKQYRKCFKEILMFDVSRLEIEDVLFLFMPYRCWLLFNKYIRR